MAKKKVELKLRTGKRAAQKDARNLKAADVLDVEGIVLPDAYDVDRQFPEIGAAAIPMFMNNQLGCCVISGRAHQTLRFEFVEQGKLIGITDKEVENQYFKESGGADNGLFVLESIKRWRTEGWKAGGKKYKIALFAEINPDDREEVKTAIYAKVGIGVGLRLPDNAIDEFHQAHNWTDTSLRPGDGHYVHICGYDPDGLTCVTWAQRQFMSWSFFEKYCDEVYALVDDFDHFDAPDSALDVDAAQSFLDSLDN
jgi:hypothetical protein